MGAFDRGQKNIFPSTNTLYFRHLSRKNVKKLLDGLVKLKMKGVEMKNQTFIETQRTEMLMNTGHRSVMTTG